MKKRRKRLFLRYLRWVAGILLLTVLLGGGILFLPIFGEPILSLDRLFFQRREKFSSREILTEIGDLSELQTVEYVYRMVFPHDFYAEGLTLSAIFDQLAGRRGTPEEILTEEEQLYLRAHNLAAETGLATDPEGDDFVVLTARVRAGYSLSSLEGLFAVEPLEASPPAATDAAAPGEPPTPLPDPPPEQARVFVRLPEATILELIIEDLGTGIYPYPEARVDAKEWRAISSFIGAAAEQRTTEEGILGDARGKTETFLNELLEQAGFADIRFDERR